MKKRRAEFNVKPTNYQWKHRTPPERGPLQLMAEHLNHACRAHVASRQSAEYGALLFQEPVPEDFLGENEDGSLSYRARSHDGAHTVIETGLAHLHGFINVWSTRNQLPTPEEIERFVKWVAEAEQELWQDYYAEEWPHIATTLQEMQLAAQAWRKIYSVSNPAEAADFSKRFTFCDAIIKTIQLDLRSCQIEIDCRHSESGEWVKLLIQLNNLRGFCLSQSKSVAWNIISSDLTLLIDNGWIYLDLGGLNDQPQTAKELATSPFYVSGRGLIYRLAEAD